MVTEQSRDGNGAYLLSRLPLPLREKSWPDHPWFGGEAASKVGFLNDRKLFIGFL
jgi:hypothetical protein